jgi:hypothetical protein
MMPCFIDSRYIAKENDFLEGQLVAGIYLLSFTLLPPRMIADPSKHK